MKTIYLIRHAKSSWKKPLIDFERGLNKRGKRDLPFMAALLKSKSIIPDSIISSPAKRAALTAQAIAKELQIEDIVYDQSIYECSDSQLLAVIQNLSNSIESVFVVGHNPGLNMLAERLTGKYVENIPTCAVFAMEFDCDDWSDVDRVKGVNFLFEYPKKYL